MAQPRHAPQRRSGVPPAVPLVATQPNADHRFSEEMLAGLLSALQVRAQAHPGNPGLVAWWPAVPAERMAAACRVLARRGHDVGPVPVTLWNSERTREGWTVGAPPDARSSSRHDGIAVAAPGSGSERGVCDPADAPGR